MYSVVPHCSTPRRSYNEDDREFITYRFMNQQLLTELGRVDKSGSLSEQLRTDREFRYFLLHLIDNPDENCDLINTIAPLYDSEVSKLPKNKRQKEFEHIIHLFNNGDEPVTIGAELSTQERRDVLLSLIPEEFTKLRDEISMLDLPTPLFKSMAHTFAFYDDMAKENAALEERIQTLRDIRQFTPDAENVFIPRTAPEPETAESARSSSLSSGRATSRACSSRPSTAMSHVPKTARLPYSPRHYESPRVASSRLQYPHVKTTSRIDTHTGDNTYLREQINARESELQKNKRTERRLNESIKQRKNDVSHLQTEIEKLRAQLEKLKQEDFVKQQEQVRLDEASKQMLIAKKKEANDLTIQLQAALAENRRLKQLNV